MICRNVKEAASLFEQLLFFSAVRLSCSRTFWLFREQLIEKDIILGLFKCFNETLDAAGVFANEGKMVDASYVQT